MTKYTAFSGAYHTACVWKWGYAFLYTPRFPIRSLSTCKLCLSVFISLSLIANKVNEEELEADGCTVHYSTAQYNVG